MASKKEQFTLQFNADTTQAKKALQDLNNSLNAMTRLQHFDSGLHQDITEAAEAAKLLQQELQKATNVNTGKLNISDFARGLSQAGTSLNELSNKLLQAGQTGQMAFNHLAQSVVAAEVPVKRMNATLSNALTTLKNTIKWEVSSTFVHGLESAFSGAVSYAKNLNTSLTNIRIVTGQSVDDMARFAVEANKAAKALSTTTKAYTDASLIYYQQGDSAEAAAKKAAITIKAANASFSTSAAEMSEYLTAVWNSYQVGADELERYVDIMAALGAKTATSLEEIATSMQKVAATGHTVGVSMEQVSSIIATVSSVTRESAESIGTSYKTIFARIGDLKLGGTTDDGIGLGQVSSQLESIGVKILDTQGNLRDMGDIITDLGNKWQTMSEAQKTATAQVVAGKRQYTQLMALFENWDMYNKNLSIADNADGELQKMADIYAESWEAASARVKASLEGIYGNLINDQALIKMTNMLADFVGGIENVIEGLGGLPGVLATIGNVATTIFRSKIAASFNSMAKSITDWGKSFQGKGFFGGLGSILKGETAAMREYQKLLKDLQIQSSMQKSAAQTPTEEMKWDSTQRIIEAKQKLLAIEQTLSEAERAASQHQINSAVEALNALEQMTMEYEEQNKSIQKLIKSTSSLEAQRKGQSTKTGKDINIVEAQKKTQQQLNNWFGGSNKFAFGEGEDLQKDTASNIFNPKTNQNIALFNTEISKASVSVEQLVKRFADLKQGVQGFDSSKSGILDVLNHLEKADQISASASRLDTILDNLKESLKGTNINTSFIDELRQKIQAAAQSGDLNAFKQAAQDAFNTLTTTSANASTSASGALQFLIRVLNLSEDELIELGEQAGLSAEQLRRLAEAARKADKDLNQMGNKNGKFGQAMANIVNGCTAALASFQSMSSAMENWDTSNLTSKVSSIGNTVLSVAGQFATGNWVGGIMSAVGAGVGYLVGQAEAAKKAAEELEKANQERLKNNIDTNTAENDSLAQLITSFNNLYAQKRDGVDVDNELAEVASKLAAEYGVTGAAIASLTGDYDELIVRLRQIANGDWEGEVTPDVATARANYQQAAGRISNNSAVAGDTDPTTWQTFVGQSHGITLATGKERTTTVVSGGKTTSSTEVLSSKQTPLDETNQARYDAAVAMGFVSPIRHTRDYTGGSNTHGSPKQTTDWETATILPTYEFNTTTKESDMLTDTQGRSVGLSFRDVIQNAGMDNYFLSDAGYAELLLGSGSSSAYKLEIYEGLKAMQVEMERLGVDASNAYYSGISAIVSGLDDEMSTYQKAIEEYGEAVINQESNRYLGRSAGQDGYNFDAFWNDYITTYQTFTTQFQDIYGNTKTPEEIAEMAKEATNTVISMNSGLSAYSSALNAAYEIYDGDMAKASAALSDLENQGYALENVDYNILQAHLRGDTDYIAAVVDADKKRQAYTDSVETYQGAVKGQSLLKEDMSFDEITQLYDAFNWGEDGIIAWEDFYTKSYEEKAAYLKSLSDDYLKVSQDAAEDAREAAELERDQAIEARDTFTGIGDEQYTNEQIKAAAAQDAINDQTYTNWLNKWYKNEEGNWTLREGAVFTEAEQAINDAYGEWVQIEGNRERGLDAFVADQQAAGANGISQAVIDEYNRLVAEAEAAGKEVDEALRNELLWEAMGNQVDSVTKKIQNLVNAITQLPTDGEELRKIADALGWDVNTLINSTEAERAAAVAAMDKPTLAKSGTETYTEWTEVRGNAPIALHADETVKHGPNGQMWIGTESTRAVSTDQDYADYAEQMRLYQEANALNAKYQEQAITNDSYAQLAQNAEMLEELNSIDITKLPEKGTAAYTRFATVMGKTVEELDAFLAEATDDMVIDEIAKRQNELIQDQIDTNAELQAHYLQIMNDTTGAYSDETKLEATQKYYDTVAEGNDLILQQEQNLNNALQTKIGLWETAYNASDEVQKRNIETLKEQKTALDLMQKAMETGVLTDVERQTVSDAGFDLTAWDKLSTSEQRANWLAEEYAKTMVKIQKEIEAIKTLNESDIASITADDLATAESFAEALDDIEGLSSESKGAWMAAYKEAAKLGPVTIESLKAAAEELPETYQKELEASKDGIVDIIRGMYASMEEENRASAEQAVNDWESAFTRIAKLRQKILGGEDITEDIFGGTMDQLWQNFLDSGYTDYSKFSKDVKTGKYTPELPTFELDEWRKKNGLDAFAVLDPTQGAEITRGQLLEHYRPAVAPQAEGESNEAYQARVQQADIQAQEAVNADVKALLGAYQGVGKTDYDIDDVLAAFNNGDTTTLFMNAQGEMVTAADLINDAADTMANTGTQMSADMAWYTQRQETLAEINKAASDALEVEKEVGSGKGDYEELTELDAALARAQAEGAKEDGDWSNLSTADQELLASYGITSFDQVDSAAIQCANALAVLAQAAYDAAVAEATEDGYVEVDGKWGKYETDANGKRTFVEYDDMTEKMTTLKDSATTAKQHETDVKVQTDNYEAQSYGFTNKKEWEEYAQYLYEVNDGQGELAEQTEELQKEYAQLAATANKISKAWDDLTGTQKTNIKTLKTAQKGSNEYRKALGSLTKSVKTIFGDAANVTEDFVEKHLEDIEKMAEGDEEAAERVEKALLDDMLGELSNKKVEIDVDADGVADQLTTVGDLLNTFGDEFSDKPIGFEITADESPALQALNNIMAVSAAAGNDISENIQSALNAIGWEPELEYQVMNAEGKMVGTTSAKIRVGDSYETASGTMETMTEGMYLIPVIKGTKKTGGGASGKKIPSSGGGGGGGGSKPKTLDKKKPEDHKERYHETSQALERLADELAKVDKFKSRAYGKGHLDAIKQEIGLLKQEIGLQEDYLKQAQEYLKLDRSRVASLGGMFNADGTISNYDELIDSIVAKYNAFIDKYNAASASAQEDMEEEKEEMDEWFDEAMEWISQYEDTLNTIRDKENEILELQNKISAKTLEGIQYKVEFEVELNEAEVDFLEYLNEKYSEVLDKQDTLVEGLIRQQQLAQENLSYLNNAKAELDAKFASGELNQADYVKGLQDINDQILENLSTLEDLRKEIQEAYGNALEQATEALDNHTEKMEKASSAMQSYISIMGLIGQGVDYEKISDFYDKQYSYNLKSLEAQQQYLEVLKEEEAYYLAKLAAGELTETERIQFEALQDTIAQVQEGILSKTEETLTALREAFSTAVTGILRDFEESVAGMGNSLEDLASDYEYYLELQERNVSTSKELYEVSKLNRQIEQDIAESSSAIYKQRLAALQEEIKAKSADRALTEYDITMMNLEYELLQRQMALEEAKSAKDTVRLTRDSSGNMVYQYTADQDRISEAQQGVEDVLQQMAEANSERVQQLEQETINTYQNMVSQIEEIANNEVLTQEEKNAKIAEVVARAQEKMLWLQDQYGIATENTLATNALIQEHYNTDMITNAQISSESMNETIAAIIDKSNEFAAGMATVQEQVAQEMSELEYDIQTVLNTTAWGDAQANIEAYDAVVGDATQEVQNMIAALGGEDGLLDSIKDTTAAWDAQAAAIDALITYYEDLYTAILQAQNVQANTPSTPPSTSPGTNPGTGGEDPSDDGEEPADDSNKVQYQGGTWQFYTYNKGSGGEKGAVFHGKGKSPVVTKEDESNNRIKISGEDGDGHSFSGRWISKTYKGKQLWKAYETGGLVDYTGPAWVDGTESEPELMLNASDTQNMLAAVQTVRNLDTATLTLLDEFIKLATSSMLTADNLHASGVASTDSELQQQVQITAEFPNVQDSNEIQDAFDNLINRAAQFISSKK